ncbi:mitochondrial transmembrane protein TMEM135_A [Andalucia godoyi]|uniref:Mitochondrial transmembrane protein TMEM135_A n=1 Tax=Andalucia godoyi TaxID=505711 RepID=A0A8K0AIJ6_ANDGO|nr:mitochondrial transmembrane protein TMEM135_A [Andalucia godoyi]|eukprot:ANDGO_05628.mRNA.1 mitochondrial transmembrane protein TMEM135_A
MTDFVISPGVFIDNKRIYGGRDLYRSLQVFVDVFPEMLKLYAPIHFVPTLLFRFRKLSPKGLLHCLKATIRSASFLSTFVSLFCYVLCKIRGLRNKDDQWQALIAGFLCAQSVEIERASRRSELAVYCIPRFLELVYRFLRLPVVPGYSILIFAMGLAVIMTLFHNADPDAIKSTYASVLKWVFGFDYSLLGLADKEFPKKEKKSKAPHDEHD